MMRYLILSIFLLFSAISVVQAAPDSSLKRQLATLQTTVSEQAAEITALKQALQALTEQVNKNTTGIGTNSTAIGTNTTKIAKNTTGVGTNTANIAKNKIDIGTSKTAIAKNKTDIGTNKSSIETNDTDIGKLETGLKQENLAWKDAVAYERRLREFADEFLDYFINELLLDVADTNSTISEIQVNVRDHFDELNKRLYTSLDALHADEPAVEALFNTDASTFKNLVKNSQAKLDEIICSAGMELVVDVTCPSGNIPNIDINTIKGAFDWAGKSTLAKQTYTSHGALSILGLELAEGDPVDVVALNDALVEMQDDLNEIGATYAFVHAKMAACIKSTSCDYPGPLDLFTYTQFGTFVPVIVKGTLPTTCSAGTSSNKYAALGGGFFGSDCK